MEVFIDVGDHDIILFNRNKVTHILNALWLPLIKALVNHIFEGGLFSSNVFCWVKCRISFQLLNNDFEVLFTFLDREQFSSVFVETTDKSFLLDLTNAF